MKTLLIITGPQGSGNHLFSKIFAHHPDVFGWDDLTTQYWVPHDKEPFAEAWNDPSLLKDITFGNYAVTSISCPYAFHGTTVEPKYQQFIDAAIALGYLIKVAIIGRDQNILKMQQERVRRTFSLPKFTANLEFLQQFDPVFLSTELLYLYKEKYVASISKLLEFPISPDTSYINSVLEKDANSKYFIEIEDQPLDAIVRNVSGIR